MRATIRDLGILADLRPVDLEEYLESHGWHIGQHLSTSGALWTLELESDTFEVLCPSTTALRDYSRRVGEILATLEVVERRSQMEILVDLTSPAADVVRVHATNADTRGGTIPLDAGVELVKSAREMMLSVACSTLGPKPFFATRRPEPAMDYVRRTKLGQSERGSYVITVVSELSRQNRELIPGQVDPFERQVTRTLSDALGAVKEGCAAALQTGQLAQFKEAVDRGVSANLCEALVAMSGTGRRELEIGIGWSRVHPPPQAILSEVKLEPRDILVLRDVGPLLRAGAPSEAFRLIGVVVGLSRTEGEQTGRVVVMGIVDGPLRKVHIELDAESYDIAIVAHREKSLVSCSGNLAKTGRIYILNDAQEFAFAV